MDGVGGPSVSTEATEGGIHYCRSDQEGAIRVRDPGPGEARRHDRIRGDDPGVRLRHPNQDQGRREQAREQARSALGRGSSVDPKELQVADQGSFCIQSIMNMLQETVEENVCDLQVHQPCGRQDQKDQEQQYWEQGRAVSLKAEVDCGCYYYCCCCSCGCTRFAHVADVEHEHRHEHGMEDEDTRVGADVLGGHHGCPQFQDRWTISPKRRRAFCCGCAPCCGPKGRDSEESSM